MTPRFPRRTASPEPGAASPFDRLKTLWERVAIFSALAYALGYVSRAIHAWDYNFGALPGARFDYLMAGLILSVPVALLAGSIWAIRAGVLSLRAGMLRHPQAAVLVNQKLLPGALLLAAVGFVVLSCLPRGTLPEAAVTWAGALVIAVMVAGAVLSTELPVTGAGESGAAVATPSHIRGALRTLRGAIGALMGTLFTAYFGLLFAGLFVLAAFFGATLLAKWPQELGGVRPKCGVLDLAVDQLSPELARLLVLPQLPAPAASAVPAIARSHRLEVYSTSGPWLIRSPEPSASAPLRRSIRLAEQAVRSVEWVARATPLPDASRACPNEPG